MSVTNVKFTLRINSSNQAVVDDPGGAVLSCLKQVRQKIDHLFADQPVILRDANGNKIGEAWLEMEDDELDHTPQ